jgi:hypothetical protein
MTRLLDSFRSRFALAARPSLSSRLATRSRGYLQTLSDARTALRRGELEQAEHLLMQAGVLADGDAAFHNLVGVLHECRGRTRQAKKSYGRAIAASGKYLPSQLNMRRLYELSALGSTVQPVALGDER